MKLVKKKAAKLQDLRDRACSLFQSLETSDEDFATEAILAYKELWEATRATRAELFGFELLDEREKRIADIWNMRKTDLEKIDGPRSRNKEAKNIILGMARNGYGSLYPEMEA
jgi:hypothetical protein